MPTAPAPATERPGNRREIYYGIYYGMSPSSRIYL